MATVVNGMVSTTDVLAARLVADVSSKIHLLEDEKISLTKLLSRLPKKPAGNTTAQWQTDELAPKVDTLDEALDNSETAIDVGDGNLWQPNDVMKVTTTGETMIVSSVSADTVTVSARSNGTTAATSAASGDQIINLGSAFAEGAGLRISASDDTIINKYVKTVMKDNECQIWRDTVALSRTEMQVDQYGGKDHDHQLKKTAIEHCRNMNLAAYHGEKSTTRRTAGGIAEFVASANVDTTATLTESAFNSALETMFRYGSGSDRKVLFCSRTVAAIISDWAAQVQRVAPGDSKFGVNIVQYQSPHGMIDIVTDHALEGPTYKKYAVLVDPKEIKLRPIQDTVLLVDRQLPDVDGKVDEYLTEATFEWGQDNFHGLFNAITS